MKAGRLYSSHGTRYPRYHNGSRVFVPETPRNLVAGTAIEPNDVTDHESRDRDVIK